MVLIAIHRRAMRSRTFSIWAHLAASSTGSSWSTSGTCRSRASNSALKDSCNITLPWRKAHKWKDTSTKHILSLTNMLKFIEMAEALWGLQELGPLIKFCQTGFLVQYLSSITWNRGHKRHNSRIAHGKVPPGSSLNYPQTACIYRKTRKSKNPKVLCQERQEAFQDPKRKSSPWERFHSMRTIPVHENDSCPWERFQSMRTIEPMRTFPAAWVKVATSSPKSNFLTSRISQLFWRKRTIPAKRTIVRQASFFSVLSLQSAQSPILLKKINFWTVYV